MVSVCTCTATHPSPVPSGSLGCASSPMVSPLPPKHPCGRDCPEPRVPDEKTGSETGMIVHARARPLHGTHSCGPNAKEILNSEQVLPDLPDFFLHSCPLHTTGNRGPERLIKCPRGHPAGKSQDYSPTSVQCQSLQIKPFIICPAPKESSSEKFKPPQNPWQC